MSTKILYSAATAVVLFWCTLGCQGADRAPDQVADGTGLPAGHPVIPDASSAPAGESLSGEVLETLDSGGYTYARLQTGSGEVWVAGPVTPLRVGSPVSVEGAAEMGSFTSTSLNRTFDHMYFVGSFGVEAPPPSGQRGLAKQVLSGSGYTYVEVDVSESISWIAGPSADAREGDTVIWKGGTEMGEFHSSTLNRTFDNILFVERIWVER
jgi:hypothetical protein